MLDFLFYQIKSGGLVVWTKGDVHFVYRGSNYLENTKRRLKSIIDIQRVPPEKCTVPEPQWKHGSNTEPSTNYNGDVNGVFREIDPSLGVHAYEEPVKGTLYEREVNRLLDSLGPRFVDWWWNTPLPVDADLLPEVVPGFKTPFRQCPPGVRPTLADEELTYLRKLARPLPTHFALGDYAIPSQTLHMLFKFMAGPNNYAFTGWLSINVLYCMHSYYAQSTLMFQKKYCRITK